jgi:hypothetical protein
LQKGLKLPHLMQTFFVSPIRVQLEGFVAQFIHCINQYKHQFKVQRIKDIKVTAHEHEYLCKLLIFVIYSFNNTKGISRVLMEQCA